MAHIEEKTNETSTSVAYLLVTYLTIPRSLSSAFTIYFFHKAVSLDQTCFDRS